MDASHFLDVTAEITTNAGRAFVWFNAVKGHEASLATAIAAIELEAKAQMFRLQTDDMRDERDRIRRAVEALPTNHVNWYGPDGEHEDHGYVVRQQDVYDLLEADGVR